MATGKQTSFEYGEISPSLHYRSSAVSYSQGLGKLRNMFVRREGGVSNRPGFEFVELALSQYKIPTPGGSPGVKAFVYWSPKQSKWVTLEYASYDGDTWAIRMDGVELPINNFYGPEAYIKGPLPEEIRFTPVKGDVFITPPLEVANETVQPGAAVRFNFAVKEDPDLDVATGARLEYNYGTAVTLDIPTLTPSPISDALAPLLPVTYLFTGTYEDGQEVDLMSVCTAEWNPPTFAGHGPFYPHAQLSNGFKLTFTTTTPTVKRLRTVNMYRAAGAETNVVAPNNVRYGDQIKNLYYKMVARLPYDNSGVLTFSDYGPEDATLTPPRDVSRIDKQSYGIATLPYLNGARAAAYYQQRLCLAMQPGVAGFKSGDAWVSKIGAPKQLRMPIISMNTGAFEFSVPITDGSPLLFHLPMERLISFSERGVYIVRGGEQGVLTPTSVNPLLISEEGCSTVVEPKMAGKRGYFINNSHTKLMAIRFSVDGNLDIAEASLYSNHLVSDQDIVQIEVLGGGEDTVLLLRRDGKMVRITATDDGIHGFALIETEGYIESIYRGKAKKTFIENQTNTAMADRYYDVLMAYVIRSGLRVLERINVRDDSATEGELFADSGVFFGYRLARNGNAGYKQILLNPATFPGLPLVEGTLVNIEDTGGWEAGEATMIWSSELIPENGNYSLENPFVLHFYYEDEEGKTKKLEFIIDLSSEAATGNADFPHSYTGYFEEAVPEVLRDVRNQTIEALKKIELQTRWLPAINRIDEKLAIPFSVGKGPVSIMADGDVISSPLNPHKDKISIYRNADLNLQLDLGRYYAYGYFGVPYVSEFETLDIEADGPRTLTDSKKLVGSVGVGMMQTRGGFFGIPDKELLDMEESEKISEEIGTLAGNFNGHKVVRFPTEWTRPGRVNIKQVDPAPMTILSVYPNGIAGDF